MRSATARLLGALLILGIALPAAVPATDVDGPDDCQRTPVDFGDAPEGVFAYPGVLGRFPTCTFAGAAGTQELVPGCAPISSAPGVTGYVRHQHLTSGQNYWLGYPPGMAPMGIDSEDDGKTNDTGAPASACNASITVDCLETAFGMSFGQDECYGSSDAAIDSFITFEACDSAAVRFKTFNCKTDSTSVYLNILVDWNQDGDWNDNFQCPMACAYEWAVKNAVIVLRPGSQVNESPRFLAGPNVGYGWLRITLSDEPVPNKFPWAGSADRPGGTLTGGETEDYPVEIVAPSSPCLCYHDFGDAPEGFSAYPSGLPGRFPTCAFPIGRGTRQLACPPISTQPAPLAIGIVTHVAWLTDSVGFWLGCGNPPTAPGVDTDSFPKTNATGAPESFCDESQDVDCFEPAFGMDFGQDECYGDGVDAALNLPTLTFRACSTATLSFETTNCMEDTTTAVLNILMDMNEDGDWNDNFLCPGYADCAYEWAVKNDTISLAPGCQGRLSPPFLVGPYAGHGWLRITLSVEAVTDSFPWKGSLGMPGDQLSNGETEDYPVTILPIQLGVGDAPQHGELWMGPIVPNPSRDAILVQFTLPREEEVRLAAYDIAGRQLAVLRSGRLPAGEHRVPWNFRDGTGAELSPGYFVVRLRAGDRVLTKPGIRMR
jgi:hypothetical protein